MKIDNIKRLKIDFLLIIAGFIIALSVFIILLIRHDVKQNGVLINNVYVYDNYRSYRNSFYKFRCEIVIHNKIKKDISSLSTKITNHGSRYLGKFFPGIYSTRYNIIDLLMLPEDFAKYGLPYPDSLRWVDSLNKSR